MMKKMLVSILFLLGMMCQFVYGQNEVDVLNYIDKYKGFAIEEQQRTGVPAAITLAQGIHETAAGNSELATQANNHFGIKCKANWTGETFLHDDDKKQECFRKYVNAQQSYIDHSDFLRAGSRYQFLFELEITDYVSWASGLKKAGYATNPAYVKKLTDLVEKYNLQQYTYDALSQVAKKPGELIPNIDAKNPDIIEDPTSNYKGLKGFWAKKGDRLQDKATQLDIKYQKLLEMNNLQDEPLPYDMFVFTERKKKTGTVEFHMVKEDENMHLIAQKEAMNLDNLYAFNNMQKGDEPQIGEQLSLQYRAYGKPKLIEKIVEQPVQTIEQTKPETPTVATTPIVETNTTITPKEPIKEVKKAVSPDIIDLEKAKKVESILTGQPASQSSIETISAPEVAVKEAPKDPPPSEKVVATPKEATNQPAEIAAPAPKVVKKPLPVMPKRTYNEPGVDDSVKALKEKFDNLVYRPFERRVKVVPEVQKTNTEAPKEVVKKNATGITKEPVIKKVEPKANAVKDTITKKTLSKKDTLKPKETVAPAEKKSTVETTKTGIIRDVKKIEEEKKKQKELEAKKAAEKNKKQTDAKKETKKTTTKTGDAKKSTPAKKTPAPKKDPKKK
jgi:hypothetical protein